MPAPCDTDFLSVLTVRRDCCRTLLELSQRQQALIARDDYTELLLVLGQKQRILGRLDELNHEHPGLRRQWQARRDSLDALLREECEHVLAESEAILAELLETEQGSTEFLTARRDAAQQQLQSISQGAVVHDAYRESLAPSTHRHLDIGQ